MPWEKIAVWLGSGAIIAFIGRTILLWGDSRWMTRLEYLRLAEINAKAMQNLEASVVELARVMSMHSEQIRGLETAQRTTNDFLRAITVHVAALNERDKTWYENGQKRHTPDAPT